LANVKNRRRCNYLEEGHLNTCLVLATQHMWQFEEFPFAAAIKKFCDLKNRRPAAHRTDRREQPMLEEGDNTNE
jgi:hypothetical protein